MKQQITIEQLNELSIKASERYREWAIPRNYYFVGIKENSLPSIGQLIEFLIKHKKISRIIEPGEDDKRNFIDIEQIFFYRTQMGDLSLCDALWEAVKEVLET